MPNFAVLLKQEISRLSRKEVRAAVDPLKKVVASLRHDVAALKRERVQLQRELAATRKQAGAPAEENAAAGAAGPAGRITAAGIRTLRKRIGLSAEQFGQLVEASGQSVYKWERGVTPRKAQLARIIPLRNVGKKEALAMLQAKKPVRRKAR